VPAGGQDNGNDAQASGDIGKHVQPLEVVVVGGFSVGQPENQGDDRAGNGQSYSSRETGQLGWQGHQVYQGVHQKEQQTSDRCQSRPLAD
jgi:hypothetical protein